MHGATIKKTYQHLVCADDVNLSDENIKTMQRNTQCPLDGSVEAGLEGNTKLNIYLCHWTKSVHKNK